MKKKQSSNAWHIALMLIGTVIGAGFASGAEIMAYFTSYGEAGFMGMILAGVIFAGSTYITLKIAYEHKNTDYGTFTKQIAGKWIGALLDVMVTLSMLLGYGVMLAGSGAIFSQQWHLPQWTGAAAMAGLTFLALKSESGGIIWINRILTPILIAGILMLGGYTLLSFAAKKEAAGLLLEPLSIFTAQPMKNLPQALGSAVLYASYNMLGAAAVLVSLSAYIHTKKEAAQAACLGGAVLLILTLALGVATFSNYDTIQGVSIPVLALLDQHAFWQKLYVGVLLGAMYTTAVSDGFGFIRRVQAALPLSRSIICLTMILLALILSGFGFTGLVTKGYRFFGYLGIGQLILMMIQCIPKKETLYEKQKRRQRRPHQ